MTPHALDRGRCCGHLFYEHLPSGCGGYSGDDSSTCSCGPEDFEPAWKGQEYNQAAYAALQEHERTYLEANGWVYDVRGWSNDDLQRAFLDHGHAVNVQKQRDRLSAESARGVTGVDSAHGTDNSRRARGKAP